MVLCMYTSIAELSISDPTARPQGPKDDVNHTLHTGLQLSQTLVLHRISTRRSRHPFFASLLPSVLGTTIRTFKFLDSERGNALLTFDGFSISPMTPKSLSMLSAGQCDRFLQLLHRLARARQMRFQWAHRAVRLQWARCYPRFP